MKKNRVLIYVTTSSYSHVWLYFKAITDASRSTYPIDFEIEDLSDKAPDRDKLVTALKEGAKVICVDGALVNRKEAWIADIVDKYADSFAFYFKENPLLYVNILDKLSKNAKVIVNSKEHIDYLKNYYGIKATFVPNAAVGLKSARRFESRAKDILVVGTYLAPESYKKTIKAETPKVLEDTIDTILSRLEKDYRLSAVTCMEEEFAKLAGKIDKATMTALFDTYLSFMIEYQNRFFRKKVLLDIIKAYKTVSLLGQNWDILVKELPEDAMYKVAIQGQFISLTQIADMLSNVKVALSLETDYKDGVHERVGAGLLAGVNMLTIDTPFARELAKKAPAIKVFNPNGSKEVLRVIDKAYNEPPKSNELPEELEPQYAIGRMLECIYGKDYMRIITDNNPGKAVRRKGLEYIDMGDGRYFIKNSKTGFVETCVDINELKKYGKVASIYTGVVDGTYNPADAIKAFGFSGLYKVYMVSSDYEKTMRIIDEFGLADIVKKRLVIVGSPEELKAYLTAHEEAYLPRVYCKNKAYYKRMTDELHKKRISKPRSAKIKPFLSIGMPTYNRGSFALRGVENLLKSEFDSEIEIMVSNNASADNTEGYDAIAGIKDSRLRYWKNPTNLNYDGNIMTLVNKAKGSLICYQSDEDYLYVENFGYYMSKFVADPTIDAIQGNSDGEDNTMSVSGEQIYDDVAGNIIGALNSNYVTGIFLNLKHLRATDYKEIIERNRDNKYVYYYTHCILMILALTKSRVATTPVKIYHTNKGEKPKSYTGLINLNSAETRYSLAEGAIDFLCKEVKVHPLDLEAIVKERIIRSYQLVAIGFANLYDAYLEANINIDDEIDKMDKWLEGYIVRLQQYLPEHIYKLLCKELVEERAKFTEEFENVRKQVIEKHNKK